MINYNKDELSKIYGENPNVAEFEKRLGKLESIFEKTYNEKATDGFSSPGRIEICGNHTDHNNGKVLVGAVDCDMLGVVSKCDNIIEIMSEGFPKIHIDLKNTSLMEKEKGTSLALVKGVVEGFKQRNLAVGGFKMAMDSKIFKGAGVSSSAAYELLIAEILNFYYNGDSLDRFLMAEIGQYSENVYFGKPCGLLDQSGISFGGVVTIDFEDHTNPKVEKLGCNLLGYEVVLVNTGDHSKLTNEYAEIRIEMNEVAEFFGKSVLREVDEKQFYGSFKELIKKFTGRHILRAIHFFEENHRVEIGVEGIKNGDTEQMLFAIGDSGVSSQINLQNVRVEGDRQQNVPLTLAIAESFVQDGVVRVHGGGFAGTILCLVAEAEKAEFVSNMENIFGKENVFSALVRENGTCHI